MSNGCMETKQNLKYYSPLEEKINITSHAVGLVLSVIAFFLLIMHSILHGNSLHVFSFSVYGISLILLYSASTFYHSAKSPEIRSRLRVIDHASIYVLIAGTYTPFALITLSGKLGWIIFGIAWGLASVGVVLKLYFTGKYKLVSTLMYILMGWMLVFFIKPLMANLSNSGFILLAAGGMSYTVGAILYSIKKTPFNHAIFHVFVLIGSFTQFASIFFHVLRYK